MARLRCARSRTLPTTAMPCIRRRFLAELPPGSTTSSGHARHSALSGGARTARPADRGSGSGYRAGVTGLRYDIVDVFTDRAFAGNPLAVVHGAAELSAAALQAIAAEFGLSETA